jgi:hypothetical protein
MSTHRIDLLPLPRRQGRTPMRYNGKDIGKSDAPIFAAARWLLANNAAWPEDTVATYRGETLCISGKAGELAKWTVCERDNGKPSLELARYRPFPIRGKAQIPASQPSPVPTLPEPDLADLARHTEGNSRENERPRRSLHRTPAARKARSASKGRSAPRR